MISTLYHTFHPAFNIKCPNAKQLIDPASVTGAQGVVGALAYDVVMVDIDNGEDVAAFERVLKSAKVKVPTMTTTHGKHYYFKVRPELVSSNCTGAILACGVKADIKLGMKNGFDCLKEEGALEWRPWENEDVEPIALPRFVMPVLLGRKAADFGSFVNLHEGSRNQALFQFIGVLKRAGFNKKDAASLVRLVNKCVIPQPLSTGEVRTICRDEAYDNALGRKNSAPNTAPASNPSPSPAPNGTPVPPAPEEDKAVTVDDIALKVVAAHPMCLVDGNLFVENNHKYEMSVREGLDLDAAIMDTIPNTTIKMRNEVKSYMLWHIPRVNMAKEQKRTEDLVPFLNGVYDFKTRTFKGYEAYEGYYFFRQIPHNYVPLENQQAPLALDTYLASVTKKDTGITRMLFEMAGSCLHDRIVMRGAFILYGPKANGKSTFLRFLSYCLGSDNCTYLKLHDMENEFMLGTLMGKSANLGDDISDAFVKDANVLKSVITGEEIVANVKYHKPIRCKSTATHIFTANFLPKMVDSTGAMMSRIKVIPFDAHFMKPDVTMTDKLCTEEVASYFMAVAIATYNEALDRGEFFEAEAAHKEWVEYAESNEDSVKQFMRDQYGNSAVGLSGKSVGSAYEEYKQFCEDEQLPANSKNMFSRRVKVYYGDEIEVVVTRVNGKVSRYYRARTTATSISPQ